MAKPDLSHIIEPLRQFAVPVESINLDPDNTVEHDESSVEAVGRSMERHQQDQPLVVQKQGMIARKGNGRLMSARKRGWTHIAALVVDESDVAAIARSIDDNASSEHRRWDYDKLAEMIGKLNVGNGEAEADDLTFTPDMMNALSGSLIMPDIPPEVGFAEGQQFSTGDMMIEIPITLDQSNDSALKSAIRDLCECWQLDYRIRSK